MSMVDCEHDLEYQQVKSAMEISEVEYYEAEVKADGDIGSRDIKTEAAICNYCQCDPCECYDVVSFMKAYYFITVYYFL